MPARCHSFYQKLFLPPPWEDPKNTTLGNTRDTSAGDQPLQHNTTTISTASVVDCQPQGTKAQQCSDQRKKYSYLHLLFYIQLRYKKNKSGQYILSFQLKLMCLSHNNDLSKVIIFRTYKHVTLHSKRDFADMIKLMILTGSSIPGSCGVGPI